MRGGSREKLGTSIEIRSSWLWRDWKDAAGYEVQTTLALSAFRGAWRMLMLLFIANLFFQPLLTLFVLLLSHKTSALGVLLISRQQYKQTPHTVLLALQP